MSNKKFIIAIPARLNSKRLPGKVLEPIGNETMIYKVMSNILNIKSVDRIFLCTDNQLIANQAINLPIKVILKSGEFSSGTDRICYSISDIIKDISLESNFNSKDIYIINIQADQPFIDKDLINNFIKNINLMNSPELVTAYYEKDYDSSQDCCDKVKLVTSRKSKRVLYFSRSLIPYINKSTVNQLESSRKDFIKYHIGVYAYRLDILKSWAQLSTSELEQKESLEQLRWIENDIPIYAFKYCSEVFSVDNINQLEYARRTIKT
tara:strand:+ start:51 stop:845 length:795 start_codon:yes stop_codon:yes gene_type:complete